MLKKFLTIVVTCLLLAIPTLAADVSFSLNEVSGKPGELVNVEIRIASSADINSIALHNLTYDTSKLEFVGFDNYSAIESKCILGTFDTEKKAIILALQESEKLEDVIATIQFRIKDSSASGNVTVSMQSRVKNNADEYTSTVSAGQVSITAASQVTPPVTHTHTMQYVEAVTPNCLRSGNGAYWSCTSCHKNFADDQGKTELAQVTLPTDINNHPGGTMIRDQKDATAEVEGYTGDICCDTCGRVMESGKVIPATGKPADSTPSENKPTDTKPENKPSESKPEDNKQNESNPNDTEQMDNNRDDNNRTENDRTDKKDEDSWNNPFTDVKKSDSYYEAIRFVYENKLFIGVSDHKFAPETTMTRAMFVTVLGRLASVNEADYGDKPLFKDVKAGEWYTAYVAWAAQEQIVLGYGNDIFGYNDQITVEQAIAILARYARYTGISTKDATLLTAYSDGNTVSEWAVDDMQWAVKQRIYTGTGKGLNPQSQASRALVADMLYRYSQMLG